MAKSEAGARGGRRREQARRRPTPSGAGTSAMRRPAASLRSAWPASVAGAGVGGAVRAEDAGEEVGRIERRMQENLGQVGSPCLLPAPRAAVIRSRPALVASSPRH